MYEISKEQLDKVGRLINSTPIQGQQAIINMAQIIQILSNLKEVENVENISK